MTAPDDTSPPRDDSLADCALALDSVVVAFGALVALDDISFKVAPGSTVGVVGPNGAGKTTLLNVLSGYVRPRQGAVWAFGRPITGTTPERLARLGMGRSFQLADQFGRLTVAEFMALGLTTRLRSSLAGSALRLGRVRREEAEGRRLVEEELETFGLGTLQLSTRLQALPYGVRKRLDIARAAIGNPRILLVDEPTSGLASSETGDMAAVLRTLARQRDVTLLIVDHRVSFVTDLCPTLVALDFGRLIGDGPSAQVLADPAVRKAFLGIAEEEAIEAETT